MKDRFVSPASQPAAALEAERAPLDQSSDVAGRLAALARDVRYTRIVRRRSRFGWSLALMMVAVYLGYILTVAFWRDLLAHPIAGGVTSWGIPVGLGVIVLGIVLTAVYVWRANHEFDPALRALLEEYWM